MKLVDANVLIYAVNPDTERHVEAKTWLDRAMSGGATVGLTWLVLLAFVRLTTKRGLFPHPLTIDDAMSIVAQWIELPSTVIVEPGHRHLALMAELSNTSEVTGNLANDLHLAALAVEHRAEIVSYDSDFARFDRVRWERPAS